jgi:hypothetical protein
MNDLRDKIADLLYEYENDGCLYTEDWADRILAIPEIRDALATHADIVMIPRIDPKKPA